MKVLNNAPTDIVLPSRHRLRAGSRTNLPDRVLTRPENHDFVVLQVFLGRLVLDAPLPFEPPLLGDASAPAFSRVALALMPAKQLSLQAVRLGLDETEVRAMNEDDLRLAVAERIFGA